MSNYKEYQLIEFEGDIKKDIQVNIEYIKNFIKNHSTNNLIVIILEKHVKYYEGIMKIEDISRGDIERMVVEFLGWDPFNEPCLWDDFDLDMVDISLLYPNCKFVVKINSNLPFMDYVAEFSNGIIL